jgi:hypothetical protein
MDLKTISDRLKRYEADLRQRVVKSLAIFGSLVHGEATPTSDIDMLVEFARPVGLFEFIRLKLFGRSILGIREAGRGRNRSCIKILNRLSGLLIRQVGLVFKSKKP